MENKKGSVTIETAVVMAIVFLLLFMGMSLALDMYTKVISYCDFLEKGADTYSSRNQGEILRIVKVVVKTGGRIVHEVFESFS